MAQINIPSSGLWSTIASALNSMFSELYGMTGWAQYSDTQYTSVNTFSVSPDTPTVVPNNAGTIIDFQKPTDVISFYENGRITGRNGDSLDIMIYFKAVPSALEQSIDVWIDIGGTINKLYEITNAFPKGAGTERGVLYALPSAYTLGTWEANGGIVYIQSNDVLEIYDINYNFDRSHKAR